MTRSFAKSTALAFVTTILLGTSACVMDMEPTEEADVDPMAEGDSGAEGEGGTEGEAVAEDQQAVDTSASYLDAAAREFLAQAGVSDPSTVGATMWVDACRVSAHQGAGTFNSGITKVCTWANAYPGWVIIETAYDVIENKNNRGSASVSSTNGPVTVSGSEFGSKFNTAISLSVNAGNVSATGKLEAEYQRLNGFSFAFDGAGNQIVATVTANGGAFKSSRIEIQARAKLVRVY